MDEQSVKIVVTLKELADSVREIRIEEYDAWHELYDYIRNIKSAGDVVDLTVFKGEIEKLKEENRCLRAKLGETRDELGRVKMESDLSSNWKQ